MTENNNEKEKSLNSLLGMKFDKEGNWAANDVGNTPIHQKTNRKQRRMAKAIIRKSKLGKK